VNAEAPIIPAEQKPRWQRRLSVALKRSSFIPLIEILALIALIVMATISYVIVDGQGSPSALLSPPTVALLLVGNLVPAMALMVLVARR